MKKNFFTLLPLMLILYGCEPVGNTWATKDIFSVRNETSCIVTVEIQNWYPLPGPGCDYIVINEKYKDKCEVFHVDDSVKDYTAIMVEIDQGTFDSIVMLQTWRTDVPAARQRRHYLPYGNLYVYNWDDTTSYLLKGAPYHSEWMTCTWAYVDDAINDIQFVITDSLLSLMEKDYSMLEKFPSRFQ
ncbi:MAG: hypothetical protein IKC19_07405 [Bacteroidales bacterium]|nr:hypothetical protein [Bacteroidales bacterium]